MPQTALPTTVNVNFQQTADVMLQQQLEKFDDKPHTMSLEDERELKIMENSLKHEKGHNTLKLPRRDETAKIPNN